MLFFFYSFWNFTFILIIVSIQIFFMEEVNSTNWLMMCALMVLSLAHYLVLKKKSMMNLNISMIFMYMYLVKESNDMSLSIISIYELYILYVVLNVSYMVIFLMFKNYKKMQFFLLKLQNMKNNMKKMISFESEEEFKVKLYKSSWVIEWQKRLTTNGEWTYGMHIFYNSVMTLSSISFLWFNNNTVFYCYLFMLKYKMLWVICFLMNMYMDGGIKDYYMYEFVDNVSFAYEVKGLTIMSYRAQFALFASTLFLTSSAPIMKLNLTLIAVWFFVFSYNDMIFCNLDFFNWSHDVYLEYYKNHYVQGDGFKFLWLNGANKEVGSYFAKGYLYTTVLCNMSYMMSSEFLYIDKYLKEDGL